MTVTGWDGAVLLAAVEMAAASLSEHSAEIDALNVYPVPDGDTGTNMSLTMQGAIDHARTIAATCPRATDMAVALARGALLGARGNSGVILSQIFRGFSDGLAGCAELGPPDLVRALTQASATAYRAVITPVEGTILSVIRAASEAASAAKGGDLLAVLDAATSGAEVALAKTPDQLAMLRQAGVVDAGGQGVVVLLSGLRSFARGETHASVQVSHAIPDLDALGVTSDTHDTFGYCTNFMVLGDNMPYEAARAELAGMGQSAVIVGDPTLIKVHIHTERPGLILEQALAYGSLSQVRIDHMDAQVVERSAAVSQGPDQICVVAVANGAGVRDLFRSLGATIVVDGGKTMNPSIDQLLKAIESVPANEVLLLPNNGNVILAARGAADLATRSVSVIPTRSIAGGLTALNAIQLDASFDDAIRASERALRNLVTVEIALADRSATIDDIAVEPGNWIGFINDKLSASANTITHLIRSLSDRDLLFGKELATVVVGDDADSALTSELTGAFTQWFPNIELEMLDGGQPHYAFVIGLE